MGRASLYWDECLTKSCTYALCVPTGSKKLYPRGPSSAVRLVRPSCVSATAVEGSMAEKSYSSLIDEMAKVGTQYALQKFAPLSVQLWL